MKTQIILLKVLIMLIGIWSFLTIIIFVSLRFLYPLFMRGKYFGSASFFLDIINQHLSSVPYIVWVFIGGLIMAIASAMVSCHVFDRMLTGTIDRFIEKLD